MRKILSVSGRVSTLWVAVIVTLCAVSTSPVRAGGGATANVENGRILAESHCAHCHAVSRSGLSPVAAAPAFRKLGRKWPVENLAEALAEGIVVGHPAMPAFAFSPAEIDDFLGWLDAIQER